MTHIALLRCAQLPSFVTWEIPNLDELFAEDKLLQRGLEQVGFEVSIVSWRDPNIDWEQFDMALIRSTWDYLDHPEHFLKVLAQIEASSCRLFNSLEAVRWNMDKHYLLDLAGRGVATVPTYRASMAALPNLQGTIQSQGWQELVLKPTLGLGGVGVKRIQAADLADTLDTLQTQTPGQGYLVQPFIESVTEEGEWSFVYFGKQLSHALLKRPATGEFRVQGIYGGEIQRSEPGTTDRAQAEVVVAQLPFECLYMRLDFVRLAGQLVVSEVELIEPILSFNLVPEGITNFVQAIQQE